MLHLTRSNKKVLEQGEAVSAVAEELGIHIKQCIAGLMNINKA